MLSEEIKAEIQSAYRQFLSSKSLKPRYGQRVMIAEIARVLGGVSEGEDGERVSEAPFCVVEAGTGTGKTVAYCLAAIPVARALGKKLVISTATVALQEQIVNKDLPDLHQHSGLAFSYALVKGRGRYLCLAKLDSLLQAQAQQDPTRALFEDELAQQLDPESQALFSRMADDLVAQRWDGDRDNWPDALDDSHWQRVTTDHRQCTNRRCSHYSGCSFFQARRDADKVDCLVANHDLVLADLALGGGAILPPPAETIYIFDEGHHLPDKAINHFTHQLRLRSSERWFRQQSRVLNKSLVRLGEDLRLEELIGKAQDAFSLLEQGLADAYRAFAPQAAFPEAPGEPAIIKRFEGGLVDEPLRELAEELRQRFSRMDRILDQLGSRLKDILGDESESALKEPAEQLFPLVGRLQARTEAGMLLCASYASEVVSGELPIARWMSSYRGLEGEDLELASSPILAAETLRRSLWSQCYAAVVTSATLTALGRFDRLISRAGLPRESQFHQVASPFAYQAARLVVPAMESDPGDAASHTRELIRLLEQRVDAREGTLVLFSSWRQMEQVLEGCRAPWAATVLAQGGRSKQELLREHKARIDRGEGSVIFGLASFAEGIDLPGPYLTHVVIAKLPFAVPDQPVEAALAEWIEARGGNPFLEVTVPDASVKLVQASGRLLRTEADSGQITLMDRRVVTRRYGRLLLDALPPYQKVIE